MIKHIFTLIIGLQPVFNTLIRLKSSLKPFFVYKTSKLLSINTNARGFHKLSCSKNSIFYNTITYKRLNDNLQMSRLMFFAALLAMTSTVQAQLSTEHYIPPHVGKSYGAIWDHEEVVLTTPSTTDIQVNVTSGDGTAIPGSPFTISSNNPARINLNTGDGNENPPISIPRDLLGSNIDGSYGLRATSDEPFLME